MNIATQHPNIVAQLAQQLGTYEVRTTTPNKCREKEALCCASGPSSPPQLLLHADVRRWQNVGRGAGGLRLRRAERAHCAQILGELYRAVLQAKVVVCSEWMIWRFAHVFEERLLTCSLSLCDALTHPRVSQKAQFPSNQRTPICLPQHAPAGPVYDCYVSHAMNSDLSGIDA